MGAETVEDFFFFAGVEFRLDFFECEVYYVVMVEFFRLDLVAEAQPETMQEIDFVGGEIRRMGTEDLEDLVPRRHMNFQVELRLGIAEAFPGFANLAGLFFALPFTGRAGNDRRRLEALAGTKNTVPQFVGGDDGEANGFAAFFRETQGL